LIEGGVISLYVGLVIILVRSSRFFPQITQQVVSEPMVCGLDEYSL